MLDVERSDFLIHPITLYARQSRVQAIPGWPTQARSVNVCVLATISTRTFIIEVIAAAGIEKICMQLAHREADAIVSFPMEVFTSVGRFWCSPSWNTRLRFARAAGLW